MRWQMGRRSGNIEDRRGMSPIGRGARVGGVGGIGVLAIALIAMFLGVDPSIILNSVTTGDPEPQAVPHGRPSGDDKGADFISVVLAQTEDTWTPVFAQGGRTYRTPQLVLFDGRVESACGIAGAATGPFYCPADQKVYLDLSFFDELAQRFGAPGDFAQAYVVAHEVGHHVQTLLGISRQVTEARQRSDEAGANRLSVMMELQADCLAGVWARHIHDTQPGVIEEGDIDEGLTAASAVGDDRIQKATRGYVVPDAFTHGSSQQRQHWFTQGLQAGDINACDTFKAPQR